VTTAASRPPLDVLVTEGRGGILLFGVTPPKTSTTPADRERIAGLTLQRLAPLDLDGLILYDLDDESDRVADDRPFPYLTTVDPATFYAENLSAWSRPVIVYRSVGKYATEQLGAWLDDVDPRQQLGVFVGASSKTKRVRTTLREAFHLRSQRRPELPLGAVMITERHTGRHDEHQRMLAKQDAGCSFFVSQVIYDIDGTRSVLSDYFYACRDRGVSPRPVIFTLAVCGSAKTLDFLQWLGVRVPRWLQNELAYADDPLEVSYRHCLHGAEDLASFCRRLGIPYGFNVESVAVRRAEIEAAVELAGQLRPLLP
jgi:hypothetical protein